MIGPAVPSDTKMIAALFAKEKDTDGKLAWYRYQKYRRRSERWDKCSINGIMVGFIHWAMRIDNTRVIYDLVVNPDFRRQGFGRRLVMYIGAPIETKLEHEFLTHMGFINGQLERKPIKVDTEKPWIMTFTGKVVNPFDIQPEDICIEDIAHHLACVNRFAGASAKPINVAQHSVYVSRLCGDAEHNLQALLHDGAEAYLGDVTKWLKPMMPAYVEAENRAHAAIMAKFGCLEQLHEAVERADRVMVMFEAPKAFGKAWSGLHLVDRPGYEPITEEEMELIGKWAPWPWRAAEEAFLVRFRHCTQN